jgi:hypothetical protein
MRWLALALAAALLLLPQAAIARDFHQWTAKDTAPPRPDAAYLLVRTIIPKDTFAFDVCSSGSQRMPLLRQPTPAPSRRPTSCG